MAVRGLQATFSNFRSLTWGCFHKRHALAYATSQPRRRRPPRNARRFICMAAYVSEQHPTVKSKLCVQRPIDAANLAHEAGACSIFNKSRWL